MVAVQKGWLNAAATVRAEWVAPVTLAAAEAIGPDWRDRLAWPQPSADSVNVLTRVFQNYLDTVLQIEDGDSRTVALMCRRFMPILAIVQVAAQMSGEEGVGTNFVGTQEIGYLRGHDDTIIEETAGSLLLPASTIRFRALRRMLRINTWTPPSRLLRVMLAPQGIAIQHNALMRDWIRQQRALIRAAYTDEVFQSSRAERLSVDTAGIAAKLAAGITRLPGIADSITERLRTLIERMLFEDAEDAASLCGQLRAQASIPKLLLTGTGSQRVSRALGLEVLRRGGSVTRFSHGGSDLLLDFPDAFAERDLLVSSNFVVPSAASAHIGVVETATARANRFRPVEVLAGRGDPSLDPGKASYRAYKPGARPRVAYVSTAYYGFHQVLPPLLPAPLYFDWQIRLLNLLRRLPVDVICKPHPEGLYNSSPLLAPYCDIYPAPFEKMLSKADVLVYDFAATTTLSIGLCTDRPIVLIDHGAMRFNDTVSPHIKARCRVVRASWDSRNRPVVDSDELADAVCGQPWRVDPSYFRNLFLGTGTRDTYAWRE